MILEREEPEPCGSGSQPFYLVLSNGGDSTKINGYIT